MKKSIIGWAVIWKRNKKNLALYGRRLKETKILTWEGTTGDWGAFTSCMIFNNRNDALKWRGKNKDWEVVKVRITPIK